MKDGGIADYNILLSSAFVCHHSFYDFLQYTLCVFLLALYANGISYQRLSLLIGVESLITI